MSAAPLRNPAPDTARGNWVLFRVPQGRGMTRSDSFINNPSGCQDGQEGTAYGDGGEGRLKASELGQSLEVAMGGLGDELEAVG